MLPRTQKGIIQLGIIGILFLLGALAVGTKLASNKNLTFFNIAEQAKSLTAKQICEAKGCPWEWKGNKCKKSESKCTVSSGYEKKKSKYTMSVSGAKSFYSPGEKVELTVKLTEPDGSDATPGEDFNVQATIDNKGGRVANANGKYVPGGWKVSFSNPSSLTVGKDYLLYVVGYCLTLNGPCEQKYGESRYSEVKWTQNFVVVPKGDKNI